MSQIKRPISSLKPIPEKNEAETEMVELSQECPAIDKIEVSIVDAKDNLGQKKVSVEENKVNRKWSQLAAFILWLIVLTIVFWLIFYSLAPTFVLQTDSNDPDLSKVLFYAFIFAFILLIFIWIIKMCVA